MDVTHGTLVDLLRERAAEGADRLGYSFLEDGREIGERLSYGTLDAEARRIAGWLQGFGPRGARALLLFPAGLDVLRAFFGCLYAGLIPIPAPAPEASRRKRTLPRLQAIVRDADVTAVLSAGDALTLVRDAARDVPELAALRIADIAEAPPGAAANWAPPGLDGGDLAYLQYTSGSTSSPKGVMISHRNVLHHCRDLRAMCGYGPDSVSLTWLPYFHDYGLIEGLMVPLQNGTPGHVMSPYAFLKRPFAWLDAVGRLGATHTQGPNFAYDQCVRRIKPEQVAALDLSTLRNAGNGAEPVNPAVTEAFFEKFAPAGLRREALSAAYGLAEATLMVSCRGPDLAPRVGSFRADALTEGQAVEVEGGAGPVRHVTSCGRPLGAIEVAIVDPASRHRRRAGEVGEVWIADPCVALGYWQRPAETRDTFQARIADTGEGPFLRTGDLGFLRDGELYLTSRIKDLIIVAGANHYPQDIEWTVEGCHPAIRPGHVAAAAIYVGDDEKLMLAPEVERGTIRTPEEAQLLLTAIRRAVSEGHELQVHAIAILQRGALPKTASGKIQRHAAAGFLRPESGGVIARWTAEEGLSMAPAGGMEEEVTAP